MVQVNAAGHYDVYYTVGEPIPTLVWNTWTATTLSTNGIWSNWANGTTAATITVTSNVVVANNLWGQWAPAQYQTVQLRTLGNVPVVPYTPPTPYTPEEERRFRRTAGIQRAKRHLAELRSADLLDSLLDDTQRAELRHQRAITVCTRGGRRFRLQADRRAHNAFELDAQGNPIREFCIVAPSRLPQADHLAAQVLMLGANLEEFERVANVWDLRAHNRGCVSHSGQPLVPT